METYFNAFGTVDNNRGPEGPHYRGPQRGPVEAREQLRRIARAWRAQGWHARTLKHRGRHLVLAVRFDDYNDSTRVTSYQYVVALREDIEAEPGLRMVGPWYMLPWSKMRNG